VNFPAAAVSSSRTLKLSAARPQTQKDRDNILPKIMASSDNYDALFQARMLPTVTTAGTDLEGTMTMCALML